MPHAAQPCTTHILEGKKSLVIDRSITLCSFYLPPMAAPAVSIVVQPPRPATELRWLVDDLIAPWRGETEEPPPFSPGELFIMALAQHDKPLTRKEAFFWIRETFGYYQRRGVVEIRTSDWERTRHGVYDRQLLGGESPFTPTLLDVVLDYNLPLRATSDSLRIDDKSTWSVDVREAIALLTSRLRPFKREGVFTFLQLPAEIRNCIYEMLFRYPRSGIRINRDGIDRSGKVYMRTRDPDIDWWDCVQREPSPLYGFSRRFQRYGGRPLLEAGKLSDILGQMLVSRQFHAEARSIFYSTNIFAFDSASHLRGVLRKMPPESRNLVERVTFDYKSELVGYVALRDAFAIVATMKSLKWLQISLRQSTWMTGLTGPWHDDPCIEDRWQFNRAARIGEHVQVVLRGDYPNTIESQIRSDPVEGESEDESKEEGASAGRMDAPVSKPGKIRSLKGTLRSLSSHWKASKARFSRPNHDARQASFEHSATVYRKPPERYL